MLKELGTVLGFSWYFCSHIAVFHPTNTLQIDTEKGNCLARGFLKLAFFLQKTMILTGPGKLTCSRNFKIDLFFGNLISTTSGKLTLRWTGSGALLERMAPSQAGDLDHGLIGFERERKLYIYNL